MIESTRVKERESENIKIKTRINYLYLHTLFISITKNDSKREKCYH